MRRSSTSATPSRSTRSAALGIVVAAVSTLGLAACTSHTSGSGRHSGSVTTPAPTTSATTTPSTPDSTDSLTPSSSPSSSTSSSPTIQQTDLVITRSGYDPTTHTASAVAILPGKVITSGICAFTITKGSVTKSVTKASTPDASSTDCGLMRITDATLATGVWSGSVTFTGGTVSATSATFTFQVTA